MEKPTAKYDILMLFLSLSLVSLTLGFTYGIQRSMFEELAFFYSFFFLLYLVICRFTAGKRAVYALLGLGVILRLIVLFAMPNLSDDIYRFIWDGWLTINGLSPFAELPSHYIEQGISLRGVDVNLYKKLNSAYYFSVYPPVPQGVFALSVWLSPDNIYGSVIVMKSVFLLAEIGTFSLLISLLRHFHLPLKNVLLYALNPLIILDTFANVHFEIVMVFFLLFAIWLLVKNRYVLSSFAFAFAVATKLLPLMFLPFVVRRLGWQKAFIYFVSIGLVVGGLFLPFLDISIVKNIATSLDLYFQKFEFNASIAYVLRYIGYQFTGYNLVQILGPALALCVAIIVCARAARESINEAIKWQSLTLNCLFAMTVFLLFTTTVHPWYLSSIIALSVLSQWRFPVLWSGLIMLTYINYSYPIYVENLWIVGIEYGVLFAFIAYEMWLFLREKTA